MSLALVYSRALRGLLAPQVVVEVHMANGLPQFTLVGLADTEVKEARERVRAAILNSGLDFPHNKRITCNLAPADLPKDSGRFDLPIALGILAASGQIDAQKLAKYEFAGELSLAGDLRPVRGALAMSLGMGSGNHLDRAVDGVRSLVLPLESAQEAALADQVPVYAAGHLLDVVAALKPGTEETIHVSQWARVVAVQPVAVHATPDLADVRGHLAAKRVLEIAAAGGHSLLMVGAPGSGKSMLAQRFAGLLPPMSREQALESAAVLSLCGRFDVADFGCRQTRAPHHSASAVALVGGGGTPRPGEISLAHHGILFLDEMPEFPRSALEALREPLETGRIIVSRAANRAEFPARFQLLAAMNPCPCGYLGSVQKACRCTPDQVARYQGKLSGPLLDRIDLQLQVQSLSSQELLDRRGEEEGSAVVRERVAQARGLAECRQGHHNQMLEAASLEGACQMDSPTRNFLQSAASRLGWSSRSTHRAMKVARTIADLSGSEAVQISHLAEAMQYRRALKQNA